MPRGVYAAASAMFTEQYAMDAVAENMANSNTPGYRGSMVVRRGFDQVMAERQGRTGGIQENGGTGIAASGSWRSFAQGDLHETHAPLDVGLVGNGFFIVRDTNGEELLTRNGSFMLDEGGRVVTSENWPVQGQGGDIIVPNEVRRIIIDREGRMYGETNEAGGIGQIFLDQFRLVDVEDGSHQQLMPRSGQYFELGELQLADAEPGLQVQQGFIEASNVDAIGELVQMVALQRRYDAAQSAMSRQMRGESFSSILRG